MVIVFDADAVLLDMSPEWQRRYNEAYKNCEGFVPLTYERITDWNTHTFVVPECGLAYYDLRSPDIYLECPPVPGAQEAVRHFQEAGDTLYIISTDSESHRTIKNNRIHELFGSNTFEDIFLVNEKTQTKAEIFNTLDADILIDDYHMNFVGLPVQALGILYRPAEYRYNRPDRLPRGVWAAEGVNQYQAHMQAISYGELWRQLSSPVGRVALG